MHRVGQLNLSTTAWACVLRRHMAGTLTAGACRDLWDGWFDAESLGRGGGYEEAEIRRGYYGEGMAEGG